MLAFAAPNVSRRIKARAHSCLSAAWLDRATEDRERWNIDSLYRAASNANEAISLGLISPGALRTGFVVENAGFRRSEDNHRFPGVSTDRFEQLTELWEAIDMRKEEVNRASAKGTQKCPGTHSSTFAQQRTAGSKQRKIWPASVCGKMPSGTQALLLLEGVPEDGIFIFILPPLLDSRPILLRRIGNGINRFVMRTLRNRAWIRSMPKATLVLPKNPSWNGQL